MGLRRWTLGSCWDDSDSEAEAEAAQSLDGPTVVAASSPQIEEGHLALGECHHVLHPTSGVRAEASGFSTAGVCDDI